VTPADLLDQQLRRDGTRPLLTWYDDSTGERIELSVATAANWAAKTANLLVDEHGLGPGDAIRLSPASHWLTAVAVLGAWTAGVAVALSAAGSEPQLPGDPARFMREVLPQPDALLVAPASPADIAVRLDGRTLSLEELVAAAGAPPTGARVLSTLPLDSVDGLVAALVTALVGGGSSVLVVSADPQRLASRAEAERVTHTAGHQLPGLPALVSG
jgi:acyl-CoA synthetase (AMP-forming)/AMP-acid ligase II